MISCTCLSSSLVSLYLPSFLPLSGSVTPLHWIYDQEKVAGLVASGSAEFSSSSHCPYYTVPPGEVGCVCVCVRVCVRACVRACVCACACVVSVGCSSTHSPVPMALSCRSLWKASWRTRVGFSCTPFILLPSLLSSRIFFGYS